MSAAQRNRDQFPGVAAMVDEAMGRVRGATIRQMDREAVRALGLHRDNYMEAAA